MKTVKKIECDCEDLAFGYFDPEKEEFYLVPEEKEKAEMAKHLKISEELIDQLYSYHLQLLEKLNIDLIDIWRRLDKIESRLE